MKLNNFYKEKKDKVKKYLSIHFFKLMLVLNLYTQHA